MLNPDFLRFQLVSVEAELKLNWPECILFGPKPRRQVFDHLLRYVFCLLLPLVSLTFLLQSENSRTTQ